MALPKNRVTFAIAVLDRLILIQLLLMSTVGLFG